MKRLLLVLILFFAVIGSTKEDVIPEREIYIVGSYILERKHNLFQASTYSHTSNWHRTGGRAIRELMDKDAFDTPQRPVETLSLSQRGKIPQR